MKPTKNSTIGTSFHNDVFNACVSELRKILGEPEYEDNSGDDKTNFEWFMQTDRGDVFTIYDWKEYRILDEDEIVEWHIGGHNKSVTAEALNEIADALNELYK